MHLWVICLPILLEEICRPILGLYKSLTETWMWKLGLRPRYSQKRNTYVGFSLQCGAVTSICRSIRRAFSSSHNIGEGPQNVGYLRLMSPLLKVLQSLSKHRQDTNCHGETKTLRYRYAGNILLEFPDAWSCFQRRHHCDSFFNVIFSFEIRFCT